MSDDNKPVRRRRIAGEKPVAAPVPKPVVRKTPIKRGTPKAPAATPAPATPKVSTAVRPTPVTVETPVASQPTPRRSRRDLLPVVVLALFAAASIAVGAFLLIDGLKESGGKGDVETAHTRAASAAGSAAETIFSFRYDKLDDHLTTSKALMTPKFAKDFDKIAPALTELAPQRKIVVEAVAREAAALPCGSGCSADKADVLVFLDQGRLVGESKTPTVFANRVKVSMVRSGDDWLVADIRAL